MKRVQFRTNITAEAQKQLKIISAIESKPMNVILEEIIKEKYDKVKEH